MANSDLFFDKIYLHEFDELIEKLNTLEKPIKLIIKHESIGFAGEHLSIGEDFLDILFIGETLLGYCENIDIAEHWDRYYLYIHFLLNPKTEIQNLVEKLLWLSKGLYGSDDIDYLDNDVRQEIEQFKEDLDAGKRRIKFYDLADDYLINYISGVEEVSGQEDLAEIFPHHPERRFGFIRPYKSLVLGDEVYISPWCWVTPLDADVNNLLTQYGGFKKPPVIQKAVRIETSDVDTMVFNQNGAVYYPREALERAKQCGEILFVGPIVYTYSELADVDRPRFIPEKIELSTEGEVLIITDRYAKYLFFEEGFIRFEKAKQYLDLLTSTLAGLQLTILGSADISCPWEQLDDERFEQLCYDVIYHSGKFDTDRIRKMGNSRSRDGGRDIEAYTLERFRLTSEKWIAQCKFMKFGGTLSGTKLIGISDMIEQYDASGLSIMTNALIDSTLYDKLEAITMRRNIKLQTWSKLELERFIARYTFLRKRYFQ